MTAYVIADLHLSADTPELTEAFRKFAGGVSRGDELYILGDLFNYYVGIDPQNPCHAAVREINSSVESRGGKVFFIHGNRDFLLNRKDAGYFRFRLLNDVHSATFGSTRVVMVHGDELCDESFGYRCFRFISRIGFVQCLFNTLVPYGRRTGIAMGMRNRSMRNFEANNRVKRMINPEKTVKFMNNRGVSVLIHGHTHNAEELRPDGEHLVFDTGDWNRTGFTFVRISPNPDDASGVSSITLERVRIP